MSVLSVQCLLGAIIIRFVDNSRLRALNVGYILTGWVIKMFRSQPSTECTAVAMTWYTQGYQQQYRQNMGWKYVNFVLSVISLLTIITHSLCGPRHKIIIWTGPQWFGSLEFDEWRLQFNTAVRWLLRVNLLQS